MRRILIFAGTTEGRELCECLVKAKIHHTVCVATEYGEIVLQQNPFTMVHCGRMDEREMVCFMQEGAYEIIVDATHPYATVVTQNIEAAARQCGMTYLRLLRDTGCDENADGVVLFEDNASCAEALQEIKGNILLTTGSKELAVYCREPSVKERLFVRVLPGMESLTLCHEQGITGKQIIAMQGPFSVQMNEALIMQFQIRCLVTKQSGANGGYQDKIKAAQNAKIPIFVVGQGEQTAGLLFEEVCHRLEEICDTKILPESHMNILLAGIGMGDGKSLTIEAQQAIAEADYLLGASRMIEDYTPVIEKKPYYLAEQIIPYLQEVQQAHVKYGTKNVVILFSGDSGFYSGCQTLYDALQDACDKGLLHANVQILPGISSVSYLAAKAGVSYQDAKILSMHGKKLYNLARTVRYEKKTFLLVSGVQDVIRIGQQLVEADLNMCTVIAGYQLSYPEEEILTLSPEECLSCEKKGLYVCLILNPQAGQMPVTHGMSDASFIRDKVPMTKEEVREVSICKLHLHEGAVVYDVGSGTGSIAMEMAAVDPSVYVYAIERKPEAVTLIEKNRQQLGLQNIEIVEAKAPDGMEKLPAPTHAFIGGSGGNLKEILSLLYRKNPTMRVVINAISMETICEMREVLEQFPTGHEEIVQMQVSRSAEVGSYHLMKAENPVWICAFNFRETNEE